MNFWNSLFKVEPFSNENFSLDGFTPFFSFFPLMYKINIKASQRRWGFVFIFFEQNEY